MYIEDFNPFFLIEKGDVFEVEQEEDGLYKISSRGESAWVCSSRFRVVDTVVESVLDKYKKRRDVGLEKYGVGMDRDDLSTLEWLEHAQEEAMDFTLYLEKIMNKLKENDEAKK